MPTLPGDDDTARADVAHLITELLVSGSLTTDDAEADTALTACGERLRARMSTAAGDAVVALTGPDLTAEAVDTATAQLCTVLAADPALAADVAALLDDVMHADTAAGRAVLAEKASFQAEHDRFADALATAEQILGDAPDDATALYMAAVALRELDRPDEAVTRLRTLSEVTTDARDQVLVADQFLAFGRLDLARVAAEAAEGVAEGAADGAAEEQPLPDQSTIDLASVWLRLDDPSRALAVLSPRLACDSAPSTRDADVTEFAARTLTLQGDPAGAAELIRALERRGADLADHPTLRLRLGVALVQLQSTAEALPLLDVDLPDRVPENLRGEVLLARGTALLDTGSADVAVLAHAAELLEGDDAAYAELLQAIALLVTQHRVEARETVDRAAGHTTPATDPVLRGRVALWQALAWAGDTERFSEAVRRADELLPPEWPERGQLIVVRAQQLVGREPDAAIALLDALDAPIPALQPILLRTRAAAVAAAGRAGEAAHILEPLLVGPNVGIEDRVLHATLLLRSGEAADAETGRTELATATETDLADPSRVTAAIWIVMDAVQRLGGDEELETLLSRLAGPATGAAADLVRAESLVLRGRVDAATRLLRTRADPEPGERHPIAWLAAAQARQIDDRPDAVAAVDRAVELDPDVAVDPLTGQLVRQLRLLDAVGRGDVATVASIGAIADTAEGQVAYRLTHGMALGVAGRAAEAIDELAAAADVAASLTSPLAHQWRVQALCQKATLLLQQDDLAGAEKALQEAGKSTDDLPEGSVVRLNVALVRGLLHMRRGRYDDAGAILAAAGPMDDMPDGIAFSVEFVRGMNWHLAGPDRAEDALRCLTRAAERHPDDVDVQDVLGAVHLDLEDPAAALDCLGRALSAAETTEKRLRLMRDTARAQRQLGRLETAMETAREAVALDVTDARSWLSLGLAQLGLGRNDAAAVAFRRGWCLKPAPAEAVAAKLVVGLTTALIESGRADEAAQILGGAAVQKLTADRPRIAQNHAVALHRTGHPAEAARALRRAGRTREADTMAAAQDPPSWLGFWFGTGVSPGRVVLGIVLMVLATVTLGLVVVDAGRIGVLGWVATDTTRLLAPLVVVVVLFLLPVLTKIKVGDVELEQPAAATPRDAELRTVNWEAIERQVTSVAATSNPGTMRVAETGSGVWTPVDGAGAVRAGSRSAARAQPSP